MPDPDVPDLLNVSLDYFSGGRHITDGKLPALLHKAADRAATKTEHVPIVAAGKASLSPGIGPTPANIQATAVLEFTLNTDEAYRQFKIPGYFVSDPAVHIHWTKSGDLDESTKVVRWRVEYNVFPGNGQDINVAPSVVEIEQAYSDSGTTTRVLERTPNTPLTGFQATWYCGMRVSAITPVGTPLASEPALFSLDLTFTAEINR